VFGRVTGGMDAVDAIEALPTGGRDRPEDPPTIDSIELDPA
jgi:cyclophilin family peptidyl-prolyl cis-trans isomerase